MRRGREGGEKGGRVQIIHNINERRGEEREEGKEEGVEGREGGGKGSEGGRSLTLVILQQLIHSDIPHLL